MSPSLYVSALRLELQQKHWKPWLCLVLGVRGGAAELFAEGAALQGSALCCSALSGAGERLISLRFTDTSQLSSGGPCTHPSPGLSKASSYPLLKRPATVT